MVIPINDRYRIKGDKYQYMVQKYEPWTDKEGKLREEWHSTQYFTSVSSAVQWLYEMRLRTSDAETYAEVLAKSDELIRELTGALSKQFYVEVR